MEPEHEKKNIYSGQLIVAAPMPSLYNNNNNNYTLQSLSEITGVTVWYIFNVMQLHSSVTAGGRPGCLHCTILPVGFVSE